MGNPRLSNEKSNWKRRSAKLEGSIPSLNLDQVIRLGLTGINKAAGSPFSYPLTVKKLTFSEIFSIILL